MGTRCLSTFSVLFVFLVLHFIHSEWTPCTFLAHLKNKLSQSFDRVKASLSLISVYLCPCTHWTNTATFNQNLRTTWYQGPLQSSHQVWSESDEWWRTDSDVHPGFSDLWQINSFQHVKRISCSVSHFSPSLILIFLFVSVVPLPRLLALDHFSQFSLHFSRPH